MELKIGLILSCISFLLFIVYNAVAIGVLGIPWSMSKTYYLYEEKKKGLGVKERIKLQIIFFLLLFLLKTKFNINVKNIIK